MNNWINFFENSVNLSYIDYDKLFNDTELWNIDFNWKTLLDIWALFSDISTRLASKYYRWNFKSFKRWFLCYIIW